MSNVSTLLRDRRKALGLSVKKAVEQLADRNVPISEKTLYGWESGHRQPDADTFLVLCDIYDIDTIGGFDDAQHLAGDLYTDHEQTHIKKYRAVDDHGRRTIDTVTDYEYERCYPDSPAEPRVLDFPVAIEPAAAGLGNYLSDSGFEPIALNASDIPLKARFGIRISGSSMEPNYTDGDIVFVEPAPAILSGELGIFSLDGEALFKKLIVDTERKTITLRSLNPDPQYKDRLISRGADLHTFGRVIGKAKNI